MLENDTNFVRLDPTLLTVSCERIKQILWRELGLSAPWSGKIFLGLYAAASGDDAITIDSEQFRDGWQYHVCLPNLVRRDNYVRAIVQVLLLEVANRNAQAHAAEIPPWLTEGFTRQLMASNQREIILPPPGLSDGGMRITTLMVSAKKQNPLELAHKQLSTGAPLTFQQLSWPTPEQLIGESGELYRSSAQLFLADLLALQNGPAVLGTMLNELPQYYNWQFAFLHAFRAFFERPLDIEKWWSLQLVHFTGRELAQTWAPEESWQKLDDLVRSAVNVRLGTNDLPLHAEVTLQTIIRDWEPARQTQALQVKARELQMLRPRLDQELIPIADDYLQTIEAYLLNRTHSSPIFPFRLHSLQRRAAEEALGRLDALDARRESLRPAQMPAAPIQANSQN